LVDRAIDANKPAYLIDDQTELQPGWFIGKRAVLITAGASAPEHLVQDLVGRLLHDFAGTVEIRTLMEEGISFELPRSARQLAVVG